MARKSFGRVYLSRTIRINSIRKGLLGGSGFWRTMFLVRVVGSKIGNATKRGEMPIRFSEKLGVGETFAVSHVDPTFVRPPRSRSK